MKTAADMEAVFEALLFASSDPQSEARLLGVFPDSERESAREALDAVLSRYRADGAGQSPNRGVILDQTGGGYRLVTRADLHPYLRKFFDVAGRGKLSMAAVETLAIVAYRQPVTSPEIQELRGRNSTGVLKTLLERRLIRIAGRREVVGSPFLYGTTREFLRHFGLGSIKDLPPLEEFEETFRAAADVDATEGGSIPTSTEPGDG